MTNNKRIFFWALTAISITIIAGIFFTMGRKTKTEKITVLKKENGATDKEVMRERENYKNENYPLFSVLPYQTMNYKITYAGKKKLKVRYQNLLEAPVKEVKDWIKNQGINPNSHSIIWVQENF